MKSQLVTTAVLATLSLSVVAPKSEAFSIGDFAFTSINSDEDGWSLVAFVDVPANSLLYFTDNEATSTTAFNSAESYHSWTSGTSLIPAGTVIRFSTTDSATTLAASIGTLSRATVAGNTNYGFSNGSDTGYLFEGTSAAAPTTILTAVTSVGAADLTPAGLASGSNAINVGANARFGQYTGPRSGLTNFSDYLPLVTNPANWSITTTAGQAAVVPNTTAFTVVPEPSAAAMVGLGGMLFGLRRRSQTQSK
jgi:hypothetical protein